jgi:type III pantothenate kinase
LKLIIDIGNTRIKAAVFEQKELHASFAFNTVEELLDGELIQKYSVSACIIATVVNDLDSFIDVLKAQTRVLLFTSDTKIPLKNLYRSASTLGSDRLASAIGGNSLAPDQNILVVDCGTCIKYNFVNASNEYIGGGISPGLQMRFKALNTFTSRLPFLEIDKSFDSLTGSNTTESILSGVQFGAVNEVDSFITQYQQRFNNLKVFLTGGDTEFFAKRLKNCIFADQFLILKGLNHILDHNNSIF